MAKPVEITDWATSGSALKTATDSSRWNLGWQTLPGNLPSETGERPNLNQQNYWQNAVHKWITYFNGVVPDPDEGLVIEDLWRWETSDISSAARVDPHLNEIRVTAGKLEWTYTDPAYTSVWEAGKGDCFNAARYYELLHYLGTGVGIQMVDGADVIWTIVPTGDVTGTDIFSADTWLERNFGMNPADGFPPGGPIFTLLDPTSVVGNPFFTIHKNDGGAITAPADFTGFSTLNTGNFAAKNPNGVRGVLVGTKSLATSTTYRLPTLENGTYRRSQDSKPNRIWIRPAQCTDPTITWNDTSPGVYELYAFARAGFKYTMSVYLTAPNLDTGVATLPSVFELFQGPFSGTYKVGKLVGTRQAGVNTSHLNGQVTFIAKEYAFGAESMHVFSDTISRFGISQSQTSDKYNTWDMPMIFIEEHS